jgi:hypothetical protein
MTQKRAFKHISLVKAFYRQIFFLLYLQKYDRLPRKSNRVTGCVDLIPKRMGVMPMKNHFDFEDLMTFGLFLLALLTFVFTFCKLVLCQDLVQVKMSFFLILTCC